MEGNSIEEIYTELGGTDTDSCKFQVTAIAHQGATLFHVDFAANIREIVYLEMKN